jgi:DNA-binding XRE family transcriptional regulator
MLRYYRSKAGMSQDQLGTLAYCSGDTVGKVEMGQRTPSYELAAACDAVPELNTGGALTELRKQLNNMLKVRADPGWFQEWARKEAKPQRCAGMSHCSFLACCKRSNTLAR